MEGHGDKRRRSASASAPATSASTVPMPAGSISGTPEATGLARRKPAVNKSFAKLGVGLRLEDDILSVVPVALKLPPRRPRVEPAAPVRSFHSLMFPLMSKAW